MKIGYSKIGRAWRLDPNNGTATGGDADVARTLKILALSHPDHEFVLIGRNSGEVPQSVGYPDNVINPWTELQGQFRAMKCGQDTTKIIPALHGLTHDLMVSMDRQVLWAGQHGTSNTPIPMIGDRSGFTNPQLSFAMYCSFLLTGLNAWRDRQDAEEVWLCPDPRNYLKARDIKWPLRGSIVAQFKQTRETKHERYDDPTPPWPGVTAEDGVWVAPSRYTYDALELTALPHPQAIPFDPVPHGNRYDFGMVVNENRAYPVNAKKRLAVLQNWVTPNWPDAEIFGAWSDSAKVDLGRPDIRPVPYEHLASTMQRWRCTLTTPASGSGWATAKPWEHFAYGTVCFFHPDYDTQNNILADMDPNVADFLRVKSPEELRGRVAVMNQMPEYWRMIINMQRDYYETKYAATAGGTAEIQRRLFA